MVNTSISPRSVNANSKWIKIMYYMDNWIKVDMWCLSDYLFILQNEYITIN